MKLLIITDNNVWGGSEVLWYHLQKRPEFDSVVWNAGGGGWLPSDVRALRTGPALWRRLRRGPPLLRRVPANWPCDAVLYVMCFFSDALAARMIEHAAPFLVRGPPVTVLVQAVGDHFWIDDVLRTQLLAFAPRVKWAFVSRANATALQKQIPTIDHAAVIHNLPFREFDSLPLDPEGNWAYVGRCHVESKGVDLLIESSVGFPVTVDIFGDGPNRAALEDYARRISSNVRFQGHVDDVVSIWRDHPVLVMTSRFEGMPLALIEAGLCGRPAVVTRVGGNPEVVVEDAGIVTEANVPAFRAGMQVMLRRKAEWPAMGRRLRDQCLALVRTDPLGKLAAILEQAHNP